MAVIVQAHPVSNWSSGLCDCGQDCVSCCCAYWCPCVVVGQIVEMVGRGKTCGCCPGCLCGGCIFFWLHLLTGWTFAWGWGYCYSCCFRAGLRQKYGLAPEPCGDYCVDCWCLFCSLAQQYRELKFRGIVPELGFEANRAVYDAYCAPSPQVMGSVHQPVQVHLNNAYSPSVNHNQNDNAVVSNDGANNYNNGQPNVASGAVQYNRPPNVARNVGPTQYNGSPGVGRNMGGTYSNAPPNVPRNVGAIQYNGAPRQAGGNQYNGPPNVARHAGGNQYNGPPNVARQAGGNKYNVPPNVARNIGPNQHNAPPLARGVAKNVGNNQYNG